ncbi:hypothetical protein F4808DRAFT_60996 [Astrocystis sublimbata]|nr:hypothetical protein F4808DRAFT_60996 [Astrocystis sublimbata]
MIIAEYTYLILMDATTTSCSNSEGRWNDQSSDHSPVELTPPSASSVGELTPTTSEDDVLQDPTWHQGGVVGCRSDDKACSVRFATDIDDATASSLALQPAWASVQAVSKQDIARITAETSDWSSLPYSSLEDNEACTQWETTRSGSAQKEKRGLQRVPTIATQQAGREVQQLEESKSGKSLSSKSLDITLQLVVGGSSELAQDDHVGRKRSALPKRRLSSKERCRNDQQPRRGRPSKRGFSCSRCTILKKKCIGSNICCEACSKSLIYRELCVRADFKGSRLLLHDLYKTRIQTLLDNVVEKSWQAPSPSPITIVISNGFNSQLEIEVQRYVAYNEDALTHRIFRGLEPGTIYPTARSTPFALRDGTLGQNKIDCYCENMACDIILKESMESSRNRLLNHVMLFAVTQVQSEDTRARLEGIEMTRLALRLWAIQAIFFTYPWRIESGGHLIGMFPLKLHGYWNGITLLPRLVNQELDRAFETRMDQIEKELLEKLQAAIFKKHRPYWCSIFLSSFILLHSLERDTWNMSAWDFETKGQGAPAWPLRRNPTEYCQQNKHIAEIVATHFKIVNQGNSPLKLNWTKPLNQQLLSDSITARNFILSIQSDFNCNATSSKSILL